MEQTFARVEELAGHVKDYVDTKIAYVKLSAAEKSSKILSNMIAAVVVAVIFVFFFIFAGIAGAYALSAWIGKMYAGFFIVSGIYLLAGIIVWKGREKILRIPIMNSIIRQLFKKENEDEED